MLLCNYTQLNTNPGQNIGGFTNPYEWMKVDNAMLFYLGEHIVTNVTDKSNIYTGYRTPYAIVLAPKAGELGATNSVNGTGTISNGNLAGGLNAVAALTGTSLLTSNITAIGNILGILSGTSSSSFNIAGSLNAVANLLGSGDITGALGSLNTILSDLTGTSSLSADIAGAIEANASLTGDGAIVANIVGNLTAVAALTGEGTINSDITGAWFMNSALTGTGDVVADLKAIANMVSSLNGTSSSTANITAIGNIESDIVLGTSDPLSPENLAAAVWNSLASSFNNSGTMGEIMNNMGAATDPWTVVLDGTYTAGEIMKILVAIAAGKTTISTTGTNTAQVTFKNLDNTVDRVKAKMNNSKREQVIITV